MRACSARACVCVCVFVCVCDTVDLGDRLGTSTGYCINTDTPIEREYSALDSRTTVRNNREYKRVPRLQTNKEFNELLW